jgi:hypothetical protein
MFLGNSKFGWNLDIGRPSGLPTVWGGDLRPTFGTFTFNATQKHFFFFPFNLTCIASSWGVREAALFNTPYGPSCPVMPRWLSFYPC